MKDQSLNAFPMPTADSCYFCEIVEGSANQWQIIDECETTMTLLNGRQFEVGQCIVIPKRHAPTLLDLSGREVGSVFSAAQRLGKALVSAFGPDGVLLYQNNGVGSGQEVPHFHLHVVPRTPDSDWGLGPPHLERLEKDGRLGHHDHSDQSEETLRSIEVIGRHLTNSTSGRRRIRLELEEILTVLDKMKTRATYSAVAGLLGVAPNGVGRLLGPPRPKGSWVVAKGTGKPSGRFSLCCHDDLRTNPLIIETASELATLINKVSGKS